MTQNAHPLWHQPVFRLWHFLLEMLAGLLLVISLVIAALLFVLTQPTTQVALNHWVEQMMIAELGGNSSIRFRQSRLALGWDNSQHKLHFTVTLDDIDITHPVAAGVFKAHVPTLELWFDAGNLLQRDITPSQVVIEEASLNIAQTSINADASVMNVFAPLLVWFNLPQDTAGPVLTPSNPTLSYALDILRQIDTVRLQNFRLLSAEDNVPLMHADIVLQQMPDPGISVVINSAQGIPALTSMSGTLSMIRKDQQLGINTDVVLSAELQQWLENADLLLPAWLYQTDDSVRVLGQFQLPWSALPAVMQSIVPQSAAYTTQDELTGISGSNIDHAFASISGSVDLEWPQQKPIWQAKLIRNEKSPQAWYFALNSKHAVDFILPQWITPDQPLHLNATAHISDDFANFQDIHVRLAGENKAGKIALLEMDGSFALDQTKGQGSTDLAFSGSEFPLGWLQPLTSDWVTQTQITALKAQVQQVSAQVRSTTNTFKLQRANIDLSDAQAKYDNHWLNIPRLALAIDAQQNIQLDINTPFVWQEIWDITALHLQGNATRGFVGVSEIVLNNAAWQTAWQQFDLPPKQKIPAPTLVTPVTANLRFAAASPTAVSQVAAMQVELISFRALQPMLLNVSGQTVDLQNVHYRGRTQHLSLSGHVGSTNFDMKTQRIGNKIDASLQTRNLPIALLLIIAGTSTNESILALEDWNFTGSLDASFQAQFTPDFTPLTLQTEIDLQHLSLHHADLGEIKSVDEPGSLNFNGDALDHRNQQQWHFDLALDTKRTAGQVNIGWDFTTRKLIYAQSNQWRWQQHSATFNIERQHSGLDIQINSQAWLKAEDILAPLLAPSPDDSIADQSGGNFVYGNIASVPDFLRPIRRLRWHSDRLRLNGINFDNSVIDLAWYADGQKNPTEHRGIEYLRFALDNPDQPPQQPIRHRVDFAPGQYLRAETGNLGQLLQALNISKSVQGGTGTLELLPESNTAATLASTTNKSSEHTLHGQLRVENFSVTRSNNAVSFLEALSLTGLLPLLASDGLPFGIMNTEMTLDRYQWHFDRLIVYGPGLSMTFNGSLDFAAKTISGKGTASPTSLLNGVLSFIPLIGTILTGVDGGGLVAVNYEISGPIADPGISSQPLSLIQPGILRNIFGEIGDAVDSNNTTGSPE